MLNYTRASLEIIMDDIRKYAKLFKNFSLAFTTGYFIYVLLTKSGFFIVNIILASLFLVYTCFELIVSKKEIKKIRKVVKKSYRYIVLGLKLFTLTALVYSIYTATTEISPLTTIFTTVMIVLWVLQVFLEIFVSIFESKVDLLIAGWNKDLEDIKQPITNIKNIFRRVKGEPLPPVKEKSKELLRLEKKIERNENDNKLIKSNVAIKKDIRVEKNKKSVKAISEKPPVNDKKLIIENAEKQKKSPTKLIK